MRGLKRANQCKFPLAKLVARSTRAWIETKIFSVLNRVPQSHALRVRGLKPHHQVGVAFNPLSHALRVRGLKQMGERYGRR